MGKKPEKKLTKRQQKFVDLYDGNIKTTAKKAKMSYGYCRRLVTQSHIKDALRNREKKRRIKGILDREERQLFWSDVIKGKETDQVVIGRGDDRAVVDIIPKLSDRLKASELLGRSEADFTDNIKVEKKRPLIIFDEDEPEQ